MPGQCCTESVVRQALADHGWSVGQLVRNGWDTELSAESDGIPARVLSCTHLSIPDSPSRRACHSAFLRIDVGQQGERPLRWAVWAIPRSGRTGDSILVQACVAEHSATVATAWSCRPDDAEDRHPARMLVDKADELLGGIRTPSRCPALIKLDPIWSAQEWSARSSPLGRDHAHMGLGVLATSVLAWPIWKLMDAPDGALAWLASVGFTGLGLLVASRIHKYVSLPSPRASELFSRLKASAMFRKVEDPCMAEALSLPVAATLRRERMLDHASIASTLLVARGHRTTGRDLRLALRTVSWPQATALPGRLLPKSWLSLEVLGGGNGAGNAASVLQGAEHDANSTHAVLTGDELDGWDGRI